MRMKVFVALILLFLAAAGGSCSSDSEGWSSEVQRELSPFVRRNLAQKSKAQAHFSPARSHYMGRHPRRLADTDCTTPCGAGQVCCNSVCLDVSSDTNNCGKCRYKCAFSLGCCSGMCVNLQTDNTNCGACGAKCSLGCSMGFCGYAG